MDVLSRGAEAVIFLENAGGFAIIKERQKKGYRHAQLDESLRKLRTKKEASLILRAAKFINVPKVEVLRDKFSLKLEHLKGRKIRDVLPSLKTEKELEKVCETIGKFVAKLHENDIVHGDLTTSNMILVEIDGKTVEIEELEKNIYFIDFGLGKVSYKPEDKAVDLNLLKKAFESKHFEISAKCIKKIFEAYKSHFSDPEKHAAIIERLESVEKRGRKKAKH